MHAGSPQRRCGQGDRAPRWRRDELDPRSRGNNNKMTFSCAIGTTFDYSIPIGYMLPKIRRSGFSHVAIGMNLSHMPYHTSEGRVILAELMKQNKLEFDSIHANYMHDDVDISSPDVTLRSQGVLDFLHVIEAASSLECGIVVFHAHRVYGPIGDMELRTDAVLKSVETLINSAKENNVKLAVENLFNKGSNLILDSLFENFHPDDLGFCYDSSHDNIIKETTFGEVLIKNFDRLLTTHLSDNRGEKDDHMIPFKGNIDFDLLCKNLPWEKYNGNILLETESRLHSTLKGTPDKFLWVCYNAAKEIRERIFNYHDVPPPLSEKSD